MSHVVQGKHDRLKKKEKKKARLAPADQINLLHKLNATSKIFTV